MKSAEYRAIYVRLAAWADVAVRKGHPMIAIVSTEIEKRPEAAGQLSRAPDQMLRAARQASQFLKAVSHESRLLLLCQLSEKERSVGELENILAMRQSTVSQQLARLRLDGMVATRRDGKTIYYSIANDDVRKLIGLLYEIFCEGKTENEQKAGRNVACGKIMR